MGALSDPNMNRWKENKLEENWALPGICWGINSNILPQTSDNQLFWPGLCAIEIKNNMFTRLFIASFHLEGMEIPETIPFILDIAQLGGGRGEGGRCCLDSYGHFLILIRLLKLCAWVGEGVMWAHKKLCFFWGPSLRWSEKVKCHFTKIDF